MMFFVLQVATDSKDDVVFWRMGCEVQKTVGEM